MDNSLDLLEKGVANDDNTLKEWTTRTEERHQRCLALYHKALDYRREPFEKAAANGWSPKNGPWRLDINTPWVLLKPLLLKHKEHWIFGNFPFYAVERDLAWVQHVEEEYLRKKTLQPDPSIASWRSFYKSEDQKQPVASLWVVRFALILILIHFADLYWSDCGFRCWNHKARHKQRLLLAMGKMDVEKMFRGQEWHRLFTSALLHRDFHDLRTTVYLILRMGIGLERRFGSFAVASVSVFNHVAFTLLDAWTHPTDPFWGGGIIVVTFLGMIVADMLVNWDVLMLETDAAARCLRVSLLFTYLFLGWWLLFLELDSWQDLPALGLNPYSGGLMCGFCLSLGLSNHILIDSPVLHESAKPRRWYIQWAVCWCLFLVLATPFYPILKPHS